jgi:hypothetical protein
MHEPRREELEAIWEEVERRGHGYLQAPLPAPLDAALGTVVERYADGDEATRETIRDSLTLGAAQALGTYAERMASQAVHEDSSAALLHGLVAIGVAAARQYEKDLMLLLPLFDRSATVLTIDPDDLFRRAADILGESAPRWLLEWPERSEAERDLGVMGYEERPSENGLLYAREPDLSREEVDDLQRWIEGS